MTNLICVCGNAHWIVERDKDSTIGIVTAICTKCQIRRKVFVNGW